MKLTLQQRRHLNMTGWLMLIACFVGPFYTIIVNGFESWFPYINGSLMAPGIVLIFAYYEFVLFTGRQRKRRFLSQLLLRIFAYSVAIISYMLLVLIVTRMVRYGSSFSTIIKSEEFIDFMKYGDFDTSVAYVLGLIILASFIFQMNRKMGPGILLGFISGYYNVPRKVDRLVMFLKLNNARSLNDSLGDMKFMLLLNDIIYDITDTIIFRKGIICEYVENEILITWNKENGVTNANAIRMVYEIQEMIDRKKLIYYEKYETVPQFSAALHYGNVVWGEIGNIKSEVRYQGDAVNTAYRLLGETKRENDFIISEAAVDLMDIPPLFKTIKMDPLRLKGKSSAVGIYSVTAVDHMKK